MQFTKIFGFTKFLSLVIILDSVIFLYYLELCIQVSSVTIYASLNYFFIIFYMNFTIFKITQVLLKRILYIFFKLCLTSDILFSV